MPPLFASAPSLDDLDELVGTRQQVLSAIIVQTAIRSWLNRQGYAPLAAPESAAKRRMAVNLDTGLCTQIEP